MNINRIQSQLQRVPDQALIGYVQNPDGKVPSFLALAELTRRKEIRNAGQAQQAPTQTVADQVVGEGLSALPLPETMFNEESYANGGIVSFAKGGLTDYTQAEFDALPPETQQMLLDQAGLKSGVSKLGAAAKDLATLPGRAFMATGEALVTRPLRALGAPIPYLPDAAYGGDRASMTPYYDKLRAAEPPTAFKPSLTTPAINDPTYVIPPTDKTGNTAGSAGSRIPSAAGGIGALTFKPMADNSARFDQFQRDEKTPEEQMAMMRGLIGEDAGKADRAARLAKMEARTAKEEETAPWMALARAGLGMAAGRSQFAVQNIAEGAQAGLSDLAASRSRLDAAREKQFEIADRMAQAERAEKVAAAKFGIESSEAIKAGNERNKQAKLGYQNQLEMANYKQEYDVQKDNINVNLKKAELTQNAAAANARLKLAEKQLVAQGLASQAKMAQIRQKALSDVQKDEAYITQLNAIGAKYKDSGGLTNPSAKQEISALQNEAVLKSYNMIFGSALDANAIDADSMFSLSD
jgi:hypothetical protein